MRITLTLAAAVFALTAATAFAEPGYSLDAKGACHDAKGHFAAKSHCSAPPSHHTYKLDAKGACHDEKGRFAKKSFCH
jgi:hypothetical protein